VILFTLVGQGLTLAPLMCRLGLASEGRDHREELEARRATVRARLARVGHWVATERKTGFVKDAKGDGCSRSIPPNSAVTSSSPAVFSRHGQRTIVLAQNGSSEMSRRSLARLSHNCFRSLGSASSSLESAIHWHTTRPLE